MNIRTNLLLFIGLLFCLLTLSPTPIEAQLKDYPPLDLTPPSVPEWNALVDMTKIPKAPVRKLPSDCTDTLDSFCTWTCTICTKPDDIVKCPKQNDWAITYDDGPSPFTTLILDHLKAKNVKATFFVIGSRVMGNPDILKRTFNEGHQIGIHTWSHKPLTTQTNEEVISELKWTEKVVKEVTGATPKFMRPPQGDYDDRIRFIAKSLGYNIAIWDYDTFDWKSNGDPTFDLNWITGNFTQWVTNKTTGHMSLEHDLYEQTAKMAPKAIDIVLNAGWNMKDVATCANLPAYIESTTNSSTPPKLDQNPSTTKTSAPTTSPAQQKLKGYPPVDVAPPANPKFTALVDLTKAPKAPVRKAPSQPCDGNSDPFCYWSCTLCLKPNDIKTCPNAKDWGITYDDEFTPAILDHLKAKNVKATFFVIGSRVSEHPEITKRAFDEGHQIGIHTWSHTALTTQTNEVVIAELQWTAKAIEEATGKKPVVMRPPQGDHDDRIRYIANELGYKVVIWDKDPNDWMVSENLNYDVSWIGGNFSEWVKEPSTTGYISLEHDMFKQSAAKAPLAIDIVMSAGFNIKTVADCVGQPAFDATKKASSTSINNYQYSSSTTPSANLLTVNSFIGLSITAFITIVSYSLTF
ncbi:10590_t:CDS:2 [Entrophospora sp. SA101]|nr:11361_t:CDS:2 [Entrophospora sp. SA101]CAJ0749299.1 10590_t:CDS:2 [Entrophospora sp. SA101]CAJ0864128.1 2658_t:CDS:2 [Entrophospora sp. SA101]